MVKSIVISTFEESDNDFKKSAYRNTRYFVNKSSVSRTLITIAGEITFKRTYYVSTHSNKKFFYIDKIFDLPKKDHYGFDKIKNICLSGDGASWIKFGTGKLRLSKNNSVKFYLSYIIIQIVKILLQKNLITLLIIILI